MRILMAASEAGPYVRTGGLGDVIGALPAALASLGHEVKVVLPRYAGIDGSAHRFSLLIDSITLPDGAGSTHSSVERAGDSPAGAEYLFVGNDDYFGRSEPYIDPRTGCDYDDNDRRFAFLSGAVFEIARALDWRPDIIHAHDWQAALVPVYLRARHRSEDFFRRTRSVMTIHNLGYQGLFEGERFAELDLPDELSYAETGALELFGRVNFLKGGIALADKITTVSERYADEIQTGDEFGCGLEGVLAGRTDDLSGIVNGVDYSIWSPRTDQCIPYHYSLSNLSGKRMSKVELVRRAGLPFREQTPLVGMVTRLASQKGIDLVIAGAEKLFALDIQVVVLGTGEEEYHLRLRELEQQYPDKLRVYLEFNDALAHWIQAGSDIFLMPSRYEPCGLNQMYALKYGTVPVVRAVGGLADTVTDYDCDSDKRTGFVFTDYDPDAMIGALERATRVFRKRRDWIKLMKTGMRLDFSWQVSAARYASLFESLTQDSG